jgi:hypothetical protein
MDRVVTPSLRVAKFNPLTHDVVFIDGVWGSGKSVLAPIMSGMERLEKQKIDPAFEYFCILRFLGKMDADAAVTLLRIYSDMDQYHNLIGREVNLRWADDSGIANNPGSLRYVRRMFDRTEGDGVIDRINRENLGLQIMSHCMLPVADPLFEAYGERLRIVEMVRHPVYLVRHWEAYLSRFDGAREFTIAFECEGRKVPWFAADWAADYVRLPLVDRIIGSICWLYERLFAIVDRASPRHLFVASFEDAVLKTESVLASLSAFLGRTHHPRLARALARQKLPRRRITQGKGHASYGWTPGRESSEREEYEALARQVRDGAAPEFRSRFDALINEYNRRWPSVLSEFA